MSDANSNASIHITADRASDTYVVAVKGRKTTQHRVTVRPVYLRELGIEAFPIPRVLHEAFAFLLERESNTSVLAQFDLSDIERYFPEFRGEIAKRLAR
jgi:hypothetical protein